jgi:O-methyltransferase involved in polyketide biosynthesis
MGSGMAENVTFTNDRAMMLATVYGLALDARSQRPVLGDRWAGRTVASIEYDFAALGLTPNLAVALAYRAKLFDRWTRDFLNAHPNAVVVNLGCGLDHRFERIGLRNDVELYDVDHPDTIELRQRLHPTATANHHTVASHLADPAWVEELPQDRAALVIGEGVSTYLDPGDGRHLISALVRRLHGGEMIFDFAGRSVVAVQKLLPVVRHTGATLRWGVDDPRELSDLGLTPVEVLTIADITTRRVLGRVSPGLRRPLQLVRRLPLLGHIGTVARFQFGPGRQPG